MIKIFINCLILFFSLVFLLQNSYVQAATSPCTTGDRNQGLISGKSLSGFYGNPTGQCVNDPQAAFANFKIPSYDELKSVFFTQNKQGAFQVTLNTTSTPACSSGSINLSGVAVSSTQKTVVNAVCAQAHINDASSPFSSTPQTVIVFIDGDLYIDGDINYGGTSSSGLVLVAKGTIYIAAAVKNINAILINESYIYTSGSSTVPVANSQQLVVNGSIISLAQNGARIYFSRSLNPNNKPAEIVNYQPKFLVLLRGLMTQSYTIEREIGPDEIPSASLFPSPTLLPSPSPTANSASTFQNAYCVYSVFNLLNILNIASDTDKPCQTN